MDPFTAPPLLVLKFLERPAICFLHDLQSRSFSQSWTLLSSVFSLHNLNTYANAHIQPDIYMMLHQATELSKCLFQHKDSSHSYQNVLCLTLELGKISRLHILEGNFHLEISHFQMNCLLFQYPSAALPFSKRQKHACVSFGTVSRAYITARLLPDLRS